MRKLPDSISPIAAFLARHSAVIALAVFAVVGVAVLDDYGIGVDDDDQRINGAAAFDYILGDEYTPLNHVTRFYGVAFDIPLIAVERLLRLEDARDVHLSRHLITHLFFLAGGFFAWLLAYRLFGSRLVALLAMLIFLLHPRIYAHSFFNTKDLPFLSMFMIALYLIHRAFRRDSVWAFALCGAGVGLLANIRIMGLMLVPAVLGMLALDALYAMKRGRGARRALIGACVFSAIFAAAFYAAWPATWRDPPFMLEAFETLYSHPVISGTLFRGEMVKPPNLPWDYAPTWIAITTPPVALALAAVGIGHIARLCAADWRDALANSTARFGLLALACLILPVAAIIALNSNVYNGWRQMYFLYAPLCVLAAFGLRWLAALPKPRLRAGAFAPVALGIAAAAVQIVSLHPLQNEYFNFLVNKRGLAERWGMNYWNLSQREALGALLKTQPNGRIPVRAAYIYDRQGKDGDLTLSPPRGTGRRIGSGKEMDRNFEIFPPDDRGRLARAPVFPSFLLFSGAVRDIGDFGYPVLWKREVYGVTVAAILDSRAETEAAFRAAYADARAFDFMARAGGFDIYADGGFLAYIKEDCGEEDTLGAFVLHAFPTDPSYLSEAARNAGFLEYEPLDFPFHDYGGRIDGKCLVARGLSDWVSHVETGQIAPDQSRLWSARIPLVGYRERYERALSSLSGEPAARSGFDIWLDENALTYVKENCDEKDTRGRFFLSVFPADPSDLPQSARDAGHEHQSLNFDFDRHGGTLDGKCVIVRRLPDYPIRHIETGQWIPDEGELWRAEIVVGD